MKLEPREVLKGAWRIKQGRYELAIAIDKQHMVNLVRLADVDENDIHIEVGTARGKSLTAVHVGHPSVKIITIDPAAQACAKKRYKDDPRVEMLPVKSNRGFKHLRGRGVTASTVYIDGDHSKKWVAHDCRAFWKLWNGKGFFGGHDYTRQRDKGWGVMEAVREFFEVPDGADCVIDRRIPVKDGVLHICDTFWFYIHNKQMHKYADYLATL